MFGKNRLVVSYIISVVINAVFWVYYATVLKRVGPAPRPAQESSALHPIKLGIFHPLPPLPPKPAPATAHSVSAHTHGKTTALTASTPAGEMNAASAGRSSAGSSQQSAGGSAAAPNHPVASPGRESDGGRSAGALLAERSPNQAAPVFSSMKMNGSHAANLAHIFSPPRAAADNDRGAAKAGTGSSAKEIPNAGKLGAATSNEGKSVDRGTEADGPEAQDSGKAGPEPAGAEAKRKDEIDKKDSSKPEMTRFVVAPMAKMWTVPPNEKFSIPPGMKLILPPNIPVAPGVSLTAAQIAELRKILEQQKLHQINLTRDQLKKILSARKNVERPKPPPSNGSAGDAADADRKRSTPKSARPKPRPRQPRPRHPQDLATLPVSRSPFIYKRWNAAMFDRWRRDLGRPEVDSTFGAPDSGAPALPDAVDDQKKKGVLGAGGPDARSAAGKRGAANRPRSADHAGHPGEAAAGHDGVTSSRNGSRTAAAPGAGRENTRTGTSSSAGQESSDGAAAGAGASAGNGSAGSGAPGAVSSANTGSPGNSNPTGNGLPGGASHAGHGALGVGQGASRSPASKSSNGQPGHPGASHGGSDAPGAGQAGQNGEQGDRQGAGNPGAAGGSNTQPGGRDSNTQGGGRNNSRTGALGVGQGGQNHTPGNGRSGGAGRGSRAQGGSHGAGGSGAPGEGQGDQTGAGQGGQNGEQGSGQSAGGETVGGGRAGRGGALGVGRGSQPQGGQGSASGNGRGNQGRGQTGGQNGALGVGQGGARGEAGGQDSGQRGGGQRGGEQNGALGVGQGGQHGSGQGGAGGQAGGKGAALGVGQGGKQGQGGSRGQGGGQNGALGVGQGGGRGQGGGQNGALGVGQGGRGGSGQGGGQRSGGQGMVGAGHGAGQGMVGAGQGSGQNGQGAGGGMVGAGAGDAGAGQGAPGAGSGGAGGGGGGAGGFLGGDTGDGVLPDADIGGNMEDTGYTPAQGVQPEMPPHDPGSHNGIPGALVLPPLPPLGTEAGKQLKPRPIKRAPRVENPLKRELPRGATPQLEPLHQRVVRRIRKPVQMALTVGSTSTRGSLPFVVSLRPHLPLGAVTDQVDPPLPPDDRPAEKPSPAPHPERERRTRRLKVALNQGDHDTAAPQDRKPAAAKPVRNSHGIKQGSKQPLPPTPLPDSDSEVGDGSGLKGEYYLGRNFDQYEFTRPDANLEFFWGYDDSPSPRLPIGGDWSIRWTGKVEPHYSETYTFYAVADDGVRLWVNHKLLIDDWTLHPLLEYSGTITLEAGKQYDIRVDYFESGGPPASLETYWESAHQPKQFIPESDLFYPIAGDEADLAKDQPPHR